MISDIIAPAIRESMESGSASRPIQITQNEVDETLARLRDIRAGELEDETIIRERERKEIDALLDKDLLQDTGSSLTGLYDLCGRLSFPSLVAVGCPDGLPRSQRSLHIKEPVRTLAIILGTSKRMRFTRKMLRSAVTMSVKYLDLEVKASS